MVPCGAATAVAAGHRLAVLDRLLAISTDDSSLQEQLDRALDAILSIPWLPAESRGAILLVGETNKVLVMVAHRGFDPDVANRCAIVPFGHCMCGTVAERREVIFADGTEPSPQSLSYDTPNGHYGLPICRRDRLLGVLTLYLRPGHRRDPEEEAFLIAVTNVLATMIECRQIEDRTRALLRENRELTKRLIHLQEERYRWLARELHDEMGQSLTAIKADVALIINHCQTPTSRIYQSSRAIAATADRLYDVTHAMIRHLRPGVLDDLGLVAALESYLREWHERRPGMACTFSAEGELERLGEEINITLYRVLQECLTNVIRHAAASRVDIRLRRARDMSGIDEVCLQVRDDGRGMAPEALQTRHRFGLLGIRERVDALGGRLVLDGATGEGLSVTVYLPVTTDTTADSER